MASTLVPFLLCSQVILLPIFALAQTRSNIVKVGDSLYAGNSNRNSTWAVSPSGDFAFGFLPLDEKDPNNNLFFLSIWYAKIPDKTVVWYPSFPNSANGPYAPKGSRVNLTADQGLVLTSPAGDVLWSTQAAGVSRGVLNDTGNFVLQGGGGGGGGGEGSGSSVWETFKDCRDTLLPSQILEKGNKLSSRLMESNLSLGRFELVLQTDGNLVMHSINLPSDYTNRNYYETGTVASNVSSAGSELVFDESGLVYVLRQNKDKYNFSGETSVPSTTQNYLRVTLNFDGVLTLYQHPKGSSTAGWTQVWSLPDNICISSVDSGSGICGYNSICSLGDNKRPNCECPKWYSLVDPNDPHGSCKPDFILGCEEDALISSKDKDNGYEFNVLINVDWPYADAVLQKPFTEEECRNSCMEDCMCSVAIFRLGDSCWKKKLPLSNGRFDPGLNGGKAFMKVRKDNSSSLLLPPIVVNKRSNFGVAGYVLLGGSAFLNLVLISAICFITCYVLKNKKQLRSDHVGGTDSIVETNLRCFTYNELQAATNGFEKELGRGAFGIVYEGVITRLGLKTRVAVKKLNNFMLQEVHKEFKNELNAIGLTHHKNLVRVFGFCEAKSERLLVYEFMSNGTLASLLFNWEEQRKPSWKLRLQIAAGVARGLLYLHEECGTQIIHCDIKPQNILLDDQYNARISDFGLAKLLNMNQSRTNTAIRGTRGYVALEWFKNMPITHKVDVYSYGVLLLEIVCCRRNVDLDPENEERAILTDWAYDCYTEGALDALVENDNEALDDRGTLEKLVMIAIWCVQEDPDLRPNMRHVTQMLEGVAQVQVPPSPSQISFQN